MKNRREHERDVTHRGHTGQVFRVGTLGTGWSMVVPPDGQVGVDGCVQYANTLVATEAGVAESDMRQTVDLLIARGALTDVEQPQPST